jgi:hypothetical protein
MATEFSIKYDSALTENFSADLDGNTLTISKEETVSSGMYDSTETVWTPIMIQPWKPNGDGTRSNWDSEGEAVIWYKENHS